MKKIVRVAIRSAAAIFALALLYAFGALVLGLFPVNRDFAETEQGISIYIRASAIHADLLLPMHSAVRDWPASLPLVHDTEYLSIGWGDRAFYLETKSWSDLRAGNAFYALTGLDHTLLHVSSEARPQESSDTIRLRISQKQLAAITAQIDAAFMRDAKGRPTVIDGAHYTDNDSFYEANGNYSLITTCNEWLRTVLANSGIRTAAWSPLAPALMYQARQARSPDQIDKH